MRDDPRYPYTYAADYLRQVPLMGDLSHHGARVPALSRADASQLIRAIADGVGISRDAVCVELADRYLEQIETGA